MKTSLLQSAALLALFATAVQADQVKTKDGKIYNGTITGETADSITIDYAEADLKGVISTTTFKKADVTITKTALDVKAFEEISKQFPTKDGMNLAEYMKLELEIQDFLKKFPKGSKKAEAEALEKELKADMLRFKAGDQKIDGKWISALEFSQNGYLIQAKLLRKKLEAARGRAAYNIFVELENTYPASPDYPMALQALPKIFDAIQAELEDAMKASVAAKSARDAAMKGTDAGAKARAQEEIAAFRTKITDEKKRRIGINSVDPADPRSVQEGINGLKRERARIAKLDILKLTGVAKDFEDGIKELGVKAYLSAMKKMQGAATLHPKDVGVKTLMADAKKGADAVKAEEAKAAKEAAEKKPAAPEVK